MTPATKPSVLFVYYSYTGQTQKLVDTMTEVLTQRGCEVTPAAIDLTDPRYTERFHTFPMHKPFLQVVLTIPAELRRKPAGISIPDVVTEREYDFVIVGAPTWWLSTDVPMRSFLELPEAEKVLKGKPFTAVVTCRRYWKHNIKTVRRLGTKQGGTYRDGIHFRYQGGQIRSLLSLLSFLGTGENRATFHGVKIPPTNLLDYHLDQARQFAQRLCDGLVGAGSPA